MTRRFARYAVGVSVLTAIFLIFGCDEDLIGPNIPGTLRVTTRHSDGSPVNMNLTVSTYPNADYVQSFRTGDRGVAGIALPPGAYRLRSYDKVYWTPAGLRLNPDIEETILTIPEVGFFWAQIQFGGLFIHVVSSETGQPVDCAARCPVRLTGPAANFNHSTSRTRDGVLHDGLLPGPYLVRTDLRGSTDYGNGWYTEGADPYSPDTIWVEPGPPKTIHLALAPSGFLEGAVQLPDSWPGPLLTAVPDADPDYAIESRASFVSPQRFLIAGLSTATYFLRVETAGYDGWYADGRLTTDGPQGLTVRAGTTTGGVDLELSGLWFDAFGPDHRPTDVGEYWILSEDWPDTVVVRDRTLAPPGRHKVRAVMDLESRYLSMWWPGSSQFEDAEWVTTRGGEATRLDFPLQIGASIAGRVLGPDGELLDGTDIVVTAYDSTGTPVAKATAHTIWGDFFLRGLPGGGVTLLAQPDWLRQAGYADTWYPGTTDPQSAEPVFLQPPERFEGLHVYLQLQ